MRWKDHDADAWKRDKAQFIFQSKPICLNLYSKATVQVCVSDDAVAQHFERYTIHHANHSDEHYYVGTVDGKRVAVRGLIHAKFLCLHHFMQEEAARNRCPFDESYGCKSGKYKYVSVLRVRGHLAVCVGNVAENLCGMQCIQQSKWRVSN